MADEPSGGDINWTAFLTSLMQILAGSLLTAFGPDNASTHAIGLGLVGSGVGQHLPSPNLLFRKG